MGKRGKAGLFTPVEKWLRARMRHRRYAHIFRGHVNTNANPPRGTGFHHRFMGENPPGARVRVDADGREMILERHADGTYRARVDVQDDGGVWRQKRGSSTFFPDNWTPQRVDETIEGAFRSGGPHPDDPNKWQGRANGLLVEGFYNPGGTTWYSAWPVGGR
ncbi:EndoU domain-containing protein [Micromonospora chalcea]|uniref:EndoU domain-containing protein n=1 Tax=Micromonospora TaxID=1873 RepID=UPI0004C2B4EA|nr:MULTISPECIES: EndoU domain-containing protein [Micromonospora]MCT2276948.1 EndoU domain-containing protein [Micromonospora chalcea]